MPPQHHHRATDAIRVTPLVLLRLETPEALAPRRALRLLYVHSGTAYTHHGNQQLQLKGGDASFVAVSEVHAVQRLQRARGWLLETKPEALGLTPEPTPQTVQQWQRLLLPQSLDRILTVPASERDQWNHRFQSLHSELANHAHGYQEAARALATLLLLYAGRLAFPGLAQQRPNLAPLVALAFQTIEESYTEPLSPASLADSLSPPATSLGSPNARLATPSTTG